MFLKSFKLLCATAALGLCASAFALNPIVDPLGGGTHTDLDAAVQAVISQGDPDNIITVQNTAVHDLSANASGLVWDFVGQNVTFVGNSTSPRPVVIMPNRTAGQYQITISQSTLSTPTVTLQDIVFIPAADPDGVLDANASNVNDGFNLAQGSFIIDGCLFSANNGSDAPASVDGTVDYDESSTFSVIGDDWIQVNAAGTATTITGTVITGANDDGLLVTSTSCFITDTVIANNGGAGLQIFGSNPNLTIDGRVTGTTDKVIFAKNGLNTGDTNIKDFSGLNTGVINIYNTDFIESGNGNLSSFGDFAAAGPTWNVYDSRFAYGAQDAIADRGQISLYTSGSTLNFERCTFHDAGNDKAIYIGGSLTPTLSFTDCVFSGAGDFFALGTGSPSITGANNAVVTNGPDAIADATGAPAGTVSQDPIYASTSGFTIGFGETNATYLQVTNCFYAEQASGGTDLVGGAGGTITSCPSSVGEWMQF